MPRLSRLRFVSIGHKNARFEDLTLDFRDAAGHATDSTLWLRNAGGKTSMLNLFFAGIRPNRREFLGKQAEAKRDLREYVQTDDHAVVAYEWELDGKTGRFEFDGDVDRFITGTFYEWRGGDLKPLYFACRVAPDESRLTLTGLPLYRQENGRPVGRRTALAFRQEWLALQKLYPNCHVVATDVQSEWKSILDTAGVDPELFRYQIAMNHREGGADDLFRFESHDKFVDFLLHLVLDGSLAETVRQNLDKHRDDLRRRKHRLIPEQELLSGLTLRLAPLHDIAAERERSLALGSTCKTRMSSLLELTSVRIAGYTAQADQQSVLQEQELSAAEIAEGKSKTARQSAATARFGGALLRFQAAQEEYESAQRRLEEADWQKKLWEAAIPLRNAKRYERRANEYRAELTHKRSEHQPLYDELCQAACQYATSLQAKIESLRRSESDFAQQERSWRSKAAALRNEIAKGQTNSAKDRAEINRLEGLLAEGQEQNELLIQAGILRNEEPGVAADIRLTTQLTEVSGEISRTEQTLRECRLRKDQLSELKQSAALRATQSSEREREAREQLVKAILARQQLEQSNALRQTLEVETVDIDQLSDASFELLRRRASNTFDRIVTLRIARVEDERAVRYLENQGLLPPSRDVERVVEFLARRIRAWSGWFYISQSVADGRTALQRLPQLAMGVIVPDSEFDAARAVVQEITFSLDSPVVIAPQSAFESGASTPGIVLGPTTSAYFDRSTGPQEQARRQAQLDRFDDDLREAEGMQRSLAEVESQLRAFRSTYPRGWFSEQDRLIEQHRQAKEIANGETEQFATDIENKAREIGDLESQLATLRQQVGQLQDHVRRARDYVERYEKVADLHIESLRGLREQVTATENLICQLNTDAEAADSSAEQASQAARRRVGEIGRTELMLDQIDYRVGEAPNTDESEDHLADKYRRLKSQYEENVGEEGLLQLARENDGNALRERAQLSKLLVGELSETEVESTLAALSDPEQAEEARRQANEAYTSAFSASGNCKQSLERAEKRTIELREACELIGASVTWPSGEEPTSWETAERKANESDQEAALLERALQKHVAAAERAETAHRSAVQSTRLMSSFAEQLTLLSSGYGEMLAIVTEPAPNDELLATLQSLGDDQIRTEIQTVTSQLEQLKREWSNLDERRARAAQEIRRWAGEERFEPLTSNIARRFRIIEEPELETGSTYYAQELDLRAKTIEEKLREIDQNRDQLVSELEAIAEDGLSVLRSAAHQSRLPENVPGVGGVQFLTITMKTPDDPSEHRGRLGELVDQFVDEESTPSGLELIQQAVRRLARPIRARVLNPDPNLVDQRIDIPDLAKFSGGERLTCAVLLYCTLAQLRARKRGLFRRPTGVLLLDNPIGSASRVTFLNLQRDVARAMGIQLIYTTGVNDYEALRPLPNLIRLRNDRANLRTGAHVVEHDVEVPIGIDAARILRTEDVSSNGNGHIEAGDAYVRRS
jgi:hypothetical protein